MHEAKHCVFILHPWALKKRVHIIVELLTEYNKLPLKKMTRSYVEKAMCNNIKNWTQQFF